MQTKETCDFALCSRSCRKNDRLVKIFTETNGKRVFFVKHAGRSRFNSIIQPLMAAEFILRTNDTDLSLIEDYKETDSFKEINADSFKLSYASYVTALADVAMLDSVADPQSFAFVNEALSLVEEGLDYEVLTNIFETQLLERLGINLNFHECAFCHRAGLPFDFSYRYSGLPCPGHYSEDSYRSHPDPDVLYLMDRFQATHFDESKTISVKLEMRRKLRLFIDDVHDNYAGLRSKDKELIDDLGTWGNIMKQWLSVPLDSQSGH